MVPKDDEGQALISKSDRCPTVSGWGPFLPGGAIPVDVS